jgi:predicted ArsR family transcriptional regulator
MFLVRDSTKERVFELLRNSNKALSLHSIHKELGTNFNSAKDAMDELILEGAITTVSTSAGVFYKLRV